MVHIWDETSTYSRCTPEEQTALVRDLETFVASELGAPKMVDRLWTTYQKRNAPRFVSRVREQCSLALELVYQLRVAAFEAKPWVVRGSVLYLQGIAELTGTYTALRASLAAVWEAMKQSRALETIQTKVPRGEDGYDDDEDEDEDEDEEFIEID